MTWHKFEAVAEILSSEVLSPLTELLLLLSANRLNKLEDLNALFKIRSDDYVSSMASSINCQSSF